jgi:single-strand DNA-binding protein
VKGQQKPFHRVGILRPTPSARIERDEPKGNTMAGETLITVIGNITGDPELRFTPSGAAVANFTVASTPRTFDRDTNEWKDADTLFMRCSIWREAAENVAESLTKGNRVIVTGRLVQRSYETNEGEKRTVVELQVDEVGPSLRYASAKVTRKAAANHGGSEGHPAQAAAAPVAKAEPAKALVGAGAPAGDDSEF